MKITVVEINPVSQPLLFTKRTLSEAEITQLTTLCTDFGKKYPNVRKFFPKTTITRKIHEPIFDIPRFVSLHKTIGRYSEEEGESLHNSVNQECRRLVCVRDPAQKLKLILEAQELSSQVDRSAAKRKPRKCQVCKDKGETNAYFKKGICQVCKKERE